jgi:hypothetical protein
VRLLELICSLYSHSCVLLLSCKLKSILGVSPKVKDSIEDTFK